MREKEYKKQGRVGSFGKVLSNCCQGRCDFWGENTGAKSNLNYDWSVRVGANFLSKHYVGGISGKNVDLK